MKRLLISAFAIAALSAGPAWAQSGDHQGPNDKNTHTQSDKGHGGDNSGSHGDHGGAPGGSPGGQGDHGGTPGGPPAGGGSPDHTTTTGSHQDHGGNSGSASGGSSDHTTTTGDHGGATGDHQDHGGQKPGVMQTFIGHITGADHGGPPHGIAPRTHRPSNWNSPPRHFDNHTYQRNVTAPRRFHWHSYQRPHGWYDHRWVFGEIMPSFFWAQNYWITDWWAFDLAPPPYGYEWVRYGDDALLVNTDTGQVLQVEYNLFD